MHDFYVMVLAVVVGGLLVSATNNLLEVAWKFVERGLEKWAAKATAADRG